MAHGQTQASHAAVGPSPLPSRFTPVTRARAAQTSTTLGSPPQSPRPRPPRPPPPHAPRAPRGRGRGSPPEQQGLGPSYRPLGSGPLRRRGPPPVSPPPARAVPRPKGAAEPQRGGGDAAARGSSCDGVDAVTGGRRATGDDRSGGLPPPVSTRVVLTRPPRARPTSSIRAI